MACLLRETPKTLDLNILKKLQFYPNVSVDELFPGVCVWGIYQRIKSL